MFLMTLLKDLFGGFDLLPSWGVPEPWEDWDLLRTATAKPPTVVSELTFNDEDCSSDMVHWPTIQTLPIPSFFLAGTNAQLAQALFGNWPNERGSAALKAAGPEQLRCNFTLPRPQDSNGDARKSPNDPPTKVLKSSKTFALRQKSLRPEACESE